MSPEGCIAALDRGLALAGHDAVLRRVTGQAGNIINVDLPVRIRMSGVKPEELIGGIAQTDSQVIMSPSEIARAQWPGGELAGTTVADPSLPRRNDKIIVDGRTRNVEFVNPISVGGRLVRIELRISG